VPIDTLLLETVVDPIDRGPLYYYEARSVLYNPRTTTVYAVVDAIPVLLPDEGRIVAAEEAAELDAERDLSIETGPTRR